VCVCVCVCVYVCIYMYIYMCRLSAVRASITKLAHVHEQSEFTDSAYLVAAGTFKGALQLPINRYGCSRFAQVPERVSTKSFVVSILGNSKSNHLGTQVGLHTRLLLPILYGVSHTHGRSEGERILHSSRAVLLH